MTELSSIYRGLLSKDARKLIYQFFVEYGGNCTESWKNEQAACEDWFSLFLQRHPSLYRCIVSTTKPFKKDDVNQFFDDLQSMLENPGFTPENIWNVDEMEVGNIGNNEKVTMVMAVNAQGDSVPPFFVLPVNGSSGSMTDDDFILFLQHFKGLVKPSCKQQQLLLLDNHSSHISIKCLNFCKENGIVLLSFPPYGAYKLQPLERAVFEPFKKSINSNISKWMRSYPGKSISMVNYLQFARVAYDASVTKSNILEGFSSTGIWPFNKETFGIDFTS